MTNNNQDTMKQSELQDIIREALLEVIEEGTAEDKKAQDTALAAEKVQIAALNKKKSELASQPSSPIDKPAKDAEINAINKKIQATQTKINRLAKPGIPSVELDEMANIGIRYKLADDVTDEQIAGFTGKKARIVQAIQAAGSAVSKMNVAGEMGYDKQNPINKDFMELVDQGVIVPSEEQAAKRPTTRPAAQAGEEAPQDPNAPFSPEELAALGISGRNEIPDEEIDASFAAAKASGEEEPEDLPTDGGEAATSGSKMSNDEFNAWMDYRELERRLAATKSNILKSKRSKGVAGDIKDKPSDELQRLRDLKKRLEDKMSAISAKYPKLAGNSAEAPEIENPEEEEDTVDEGLKHRLQYFAGIKK